MRKLIWILASVLIIVIVALLMVSKAYKDSPDYNYVSAKLDIKNGNIRIIHTGLRDSSLQNKEIDKLTEKYGFRNIYIGNDTTKQIISGIENYNEVMEAYLNVRNGADWRKMYQTEIDSLNKVSGR